MKWQSSLLSTPVCEGTEQPAVTLSFTVVIRCHGGFSLLLPLLKRGRATGQIHPAYQTKPFVGL